MELYVILQIIMDLENRIGQHFILGFQGHDLNDASPIIEDIRRRNLGGVILFDTFLFGRQRSNNIHSFGQLQKLCKKLQDNAATRLFITIDQEGGKVCRLKEKHGFHVMPSAEEMGRDSNCKISSSVAHKTGELLAEIGINCDFTPVADVNINPANPVIGSLGRSFSNDPDMVANHCMAWLEGLHSHKVLGCLKHFPGHGSSTEDSHKGLVDITHSWQNIELKPYERIIQTGKAQAVMVGHLYLKQIDQEFPASLSSKIIQQLLRNKLNFNGLVFTDDLQMRGITDKYGLLDAIVLALAAGVDLIIIGNNLDYEPDILQKAIAHVKKAILKGKLSEQILHQSHQRISTTKGSFYEQSSG